MQLLRPSAVIVAMGVNQILAFASSYYLAAVLAAPMAHDLGVATSTIYAAFSVALLVSALAGPHIGRAFDRFGGRPVLMATSVLFALALVLVATAQGAAWMFAGWALLGLAMCSGLYEGAFATLVRMYGEGARNPITGVTLFGGFASTVGWPLSAWMAAHFGWRGACVGWALLHLVVALPLYALLPRAAAAPAHGDVPDAGADDAGTRKASTLRASLLLALVFAVAWFNSTAMASHLPALLVIAGASAAAAVAIASLVGPAQVGGRILEFGLLRRLHPLLSTRVATLSHPAGAALLAFAGAPAAAAFVVLHGAGNGILTIAKGTLPLAIFGAAGYGERQGLLMMPARVAQAAAPWLFGLAIERWGLGALWLSSALALLAFAALMLLRAPVRPFRTRLGGEGVRD
ncbi:MFS transporter [Variovorax sp. OV329]|uniref:MFS transporter n=1 Tax=Variovorax sp. OV329 TaxID=1882825 RepID=UPI0008F3DEA7|nr:MFS transporter [Variovorax sp. OV329]SFN08183.1 Predicted arabinose efflux permease, MFS family [Variovorax sp. OV329]